MTTAPETSKFSLLQWRKPAGILFTVAVLGVFGLTEVAQAQSSSLEIAYPKSLKTANKIGKPAKVKKPSRVTIKASYLGSAPWICTPSGFGRTSKCFAR